MYKLPICYNSNQECREYSRLSGKKTKNNINFQETLHRFMNKGFTMYKKNHTRALKKYFPESKKAHKSVYLLLDLKGKNLKQNKITPPRTYGSSIHLLEMWCTQKFEEDAYPKFPCE